MPFFRNHTMQGSRAQEPWAYSRRALGIIRRFVRLRYRLLPYLYNLFIDQEARGEAILRPLFHDFEDTPSLALGGVDDQFMVGPAIMQAPFVRGKSRQRTVVLPGGRWFRADTGRWVQGGRRLRVRRQAASSPVFLREGSLVAFQPGERTSSRNDLKCIGLLGCVSPQFSGCARLDYGVDDGLSFDYRRGRRTRVAIEARLQAQRLELKLAARAEGFGRVQVTFYSLNRFREVLVTNRGQKRSLRPSKETVRLTGKKFHWCRWRPAIAV
jgi:alpha-glucosidase